VQCYFNQGDSIYNKLWALKFPESIIQVCFVFYFILTFFFLFKKCNRHVRPGICWWQFSRTDMHMKYSRIKENLCVCMGRWTWWWRQQDPLKCHCTCTSLLDVTSQKAGLFIVTTWKVLFFSVHKGYLYTHLGINSACRTGNTVYITEVWNKDYLLMTSTFRGMVHMTLTVKEHVAGSLI
jgi:hypothetical protein